MRPPSPGLLLPSAQARSVPSGLRVALELTGLKSGSLVPLISFTAEEDEELS